MGTLSARFQDNIAIKETTDELIDKTLDINVKGILYAIRAVTPIMSYEALFITRGEY